MHPLIFNMPTPSTLCIHTSIHSFFSFYFLSFSNFLSFSTFLFVPHQHIFFSPLFFISTTDKQKLTERLAATQAELQSSETKVVRMQNECNDVRLMAQSFAETAGAEKRKQSQEASALVGL